MLATDVVELKKQLATTLQEKGQLHALASHLRVQHEENIQSLEENLKSQHEKMLVSNDTNVELIESLSVATDELGKLGIAKGK